MNQIIAECNYTSTSYSPEKTSIVNNIQVVATAPTFTGASNAGLRSGAPPRLPSGAVGTVLLSVLIGFAFSL